MEVLESKIESITEYHLVTIDTPHGKMFLRVEVENNNTIISHIETDDSDIWNNLTFEEKQEVDEALENEFIF